MFRFWIIAALAALTLIGLPEKGVSNGAQDLRNNLVKKEEKKRLALAELYQVRHQIRLVKFKSERLHSEKIDVERKARELARKVAGLDSQLKQGRERLRQRLVSVYKRRGEPLMKYLFSSQSSLELEKNLQIIQFISERDYRLLQVFQSDQKALRTQRRNLHAEVRRLKTIESNLETENRSLLEQQSRHDSLLRKIEAERLVTVSELARLNQTEDINDAGSIGFEARKGALEPPLSTAISTSFGVLPEMDGLRMRMKGVFFPAVPGTSAQAVWNGLVSHSGPLRGLGQVLIIDHGEHYYSVYAQTGRILVRVGERVKAGQAVALTGSPTHRFGQGLYFEIRHFSDPLNPADWLKLNYGTYSMWSRGQK